MNFTSYMDAVNVLFDNYFGLGFEDFPDINYKVFYEDGLSPNDVFDNFLEVYPEYVI